VLLASVGWLPWTVHRLTNVRSLSDGKRLWLMRTCQSQGILERVSFHLHKTIITRHLCLRNDPLCDSVPSINQPSHVRTLDRAAKLRHKYFQRNSTFLQNFPTSDGSSPQISASLVLSHQIQTLDTLPVSSRASIFGTSPWSVQLDNQENHRR